MGRAAVNFEKKYANNPSRGLEIASRIGNAAATRNPKATIAATPELIKFATTGEGEKVLKKGRGLYLGIEKIYY